MSSHKNIGLVPFTWNDFDREIERLFHHVPAAKNQHDVWHPAVDLKEEADKYLVVVDIPGVDKKDLEVHMEKDTLVIKGSREHEKKEEIKNFVKMERSHGYFCRSFYLPETDSEKINAKYENGVLRVTVQKSGKHVGRKIEVES